MRAQHPVAFAFGLAFAATLVGISDSAAQTRRITMDPNAKRVLVATFRGPDKKLGMEAGEALRERLPKEIPLKQLWVITKDDMVANLEPSGYKYEDALTTSDARILAANMRADVFVEGTAIGTPGNIKITAWMVPVRDQRIRQPLPVSTGRRVDHAMDPVAKSFKEAWKQWDGFERCENAYRAKKFPEAASAAREGIVAFPQAAMARICLASALQNTGAPADTILKIVNEVLANDSLNYYGLAYAAHAYKQKGDSAKATELLLTLLATEPTNVKLQLEVINDLASTRNFSVAIPIIDRAIAANPGDPELIRLRFKILVAIEEWKQAIVSGEELLRTDTSATDTTFFINLASAYGKDSQPQRAAESIARGIGKYPDYARLYLIQAQYLRAAGKQMESINSVREGLRRDPTMPDATLGYLTIVQTFLDLGQIDSVAPTLRLAASVSKTADDSNKVSLFAMQQGSKEFSAARADSLDPARAPVAREQFARSIQWFALADSLSPSNQAKFQIGAAAYYITFNLIQKEIGLNQKTLGNEGLCNLGRIGQQYATMAQLQMQKAGAFNPAAAGQIMNAVLTVFSPHLDQVVKNTCK